MRYCIYNKIIVRYLPSMTVVNLYTLKYIPLVCLIVCVSMRYYIRYYHLGVKLIVIVAVENLVVILLLFIIYYYCEYTKHANAFGHIVLFRRIHIIGR